MKGLHHREYDTKSMDEAKSIMDVAILADTIWDTRQWTSSLKPPATMLSTKEISQLDEHLKNIHVNVKKAKQSDPQWLLKVKEVIIDLKDLTEDLRHKEGTTSGTRSLFSRVKFTYQVKKAAEEVKRLSEQAQVPPFSEEAGKNQGKRLAGGDGCDEKTVMAVGRENEKKEIIDQLLNSDAPVIVIVGVPGIGKTKLAGLVCDDEQVKAHFGSPIWVDCHQNEEAFDVESIAKRVTDHQSSGNKRRQLLVLDDLRIENIDGNRLQQLGAILITTRSNLVANNIAGSGVPVRSYVLQVLNEQESWSLFQQIRERDSTSNVITEQEIVREYGGVPLAILTIARLLNNRRGNNSSVPLEEEFLQELKYTYYDDLPTYQKLCFAYCSLFPREYLFDAEKLIQLWMAEGFITRNNPEEFGRACFDDFVPLVFEEALEEEEDECGGVRRLYRLNRLMHELARVVVVSDKNVTIDSEGMQRASFDFALDLTCGIPDSVFEGAKKLRSILLPYNNKLLSRRLPHEVRMSTSTCDRIFNTFKRLHVLELHDLGIKMVPSSIGEMKHLTHLDLSHNNIEKLPSSITKLVHLLTLKLSQCHVLKELPEDLEKLCSLKHLYIDGCLDLTHIPPGIHKLACLQTLSLFVASKKQNMGGLRELTGLNNLKGHLEILHLEQVKLSPKNSKVEEAKDAYLKKKQQLQCLTLRWDHDDDEEEEEAKDANLKNKQQLQCLTKLTLRRYHDDDEEEEEVKENDIDNKSLECLEPHPNLRALFVVGYNGHMFSTWLSSLHCLVKFTLNKCPKCQSLPPLDHLPLLKVLQIRRLDSLEFIASSNNSSSEGSLTTPFFPSLKELSISDCPKLRSWWGNETGKSDRPLFFTRISKLNVQDCPMLACMPLYPYLDEELVLVDSNVGSMRDTMHAETSQDFPPFSKLKSMLIERIHEQSPPESWLKNFISLEKLHIRDCSHLESLPQGFKSLTSLQCLTIERCPRLDLDISKDEWEGLRNLRSLTLRDIPKLKSLPWGVENVGSLQYLRIYECSGLMFLPESIGNLTSLCKLVISECRSLGSLPKGMAKLESLHTLIVTDCPLLLPRCQPDTGDDWPQIAHVDNVQVKENPHYDEACVIS